MNGSAFTTSSIFRMTRSKTRICGPMQRLSMVCSCRSVPHFTNSSGALNHILHPLSCLVIQPMESISRCFFYAWVSTRCVWRQLNAKITLQAKWISHTSFQSWLLDFADVSVRQQHSIHSHHRFSIFTLPSYTAVTSHETSLKACQKRKKTCHTWHSLSSR